MTTTKKKKYSVFTDKRAVFSLTLILIGITVFTAAAAGLYSKEVTAFDELLLKKLRGGESGPLWLKIFMEDVTTLGGGTIVFLLASFVVFYLLLIKRISSALLVMAASLGGGIINYILKSVFQRQRPSIIEILVDVDSLSFPSGHSAISAAVYLSLAALLSRVYRDHSVRFYFLFIAALLTLLIGYSRIYLGVHYPIDVVAGWAVGLSWAAFCWLAAFYLQRKRMIEPADE